MSADVDLERLARRGLAEGLSDDEILELFSDHGVDTDTAEETLEAVKDNADIDRDNPLDELDDFSEPTDEPEAKPADNPANDETFDEAFNDDNTMDDLKEDDYNVFSKLTSWFTGDKDDEPGGVDDELDDLEPIDDEAVGDEAFDDDITLDDEPETPSADDIDDLKDIAREALNKGLNDEKIISLFTDHGIDDDQAHTILNDVKTKHDAQPQQEEQAQSQSQENTAQSTGSKDTIEPKHTTTTQQPDNQSDSQDGQATKTNNALRKLAREGIDKGLNDDELIAFFTNNGLTEDQAVNVIEAERDRPVQRQTTTSSEQASSSTDEVHTVGKERHKHRGQHQTESDVKERDAINVQKEASYTKNEDNVTTTTTEQSADGTDAFMAGMDKEQEHLEVGRIFLTGRKPSYGRMHVSGLSDLVDREVETQGRTGFIDLSGSSSRDDEDNDYTDTADSGFNDDLDMSDKVSSRVQELREIAEDAS
jgi:hypothetical protein